MTTHSVSPQPLAPYPDQTYSAVERKDGSFELELQGNVKERLTQSELNALFKKKTTQ